MSEQKDRIRCRKCELVQWRDKPNCRRRGEPLPEPIVKIVERIVVEKVVVRHGAQCLENLEQARQLLVAAERDCYGTPILDGALRGRIAAKGAGSRAMRDYSR